MKRPLLLFYPVRRSPLGTSVPSETLGGEVESGFGSRTPGEGRDSDVTPLSLRPLSLTTVLSQGFQRRPVQSPPETRLNMVCQ